MNLEAFEAALEADAPPDGMAPALAALWWDARGDWEQAHRLAQEAGGADGAWVHAYLHRVEGDNGNAAYWYRRAGQPVASDPTEAERTRIVQALDGP